MEIRKFSGSEQDLRSGRGRAMSPESLAIRDAIMDSATNGSRHEIVVGSAKERDTLSQRARNIASQLGCKISLWRTAEDNLVLWVTSTSDATPAMVPATATATPAATDGETAPRPRSRRTSRK